MRFSKFNINNFRNNELGLIMKATSNRMTALQRAMKGNAVDQAYFREVVEMTALACNLLPCQLWQAMQSSDPLNVLTRIQHRKGITVVHEKYADSVRNRFSWALTLRHPNDRTEKQLDKLNKEQEAEIAKSILAA